MLTALVVGNMIGSGVFLLPTTLAHYGSITIFSWIATGIGAMLLALVFAKLSTLFPKTGGPYVYCRESFGDFVGFQVAYNYWIYMWVGNAAIAVAFTGYLTTFIPQLQFNPMLAFFVTAGAVWLITLINIMGVHFAGVVQLVLTILKFVPLLLIAFVGLFFIDMDNLSQFNLSGESNFSALSSGAMLTLWAFLGLESASIPADDVKNPKKNIPRATIIGTGITAIVYILSTIAIMGVIPSSVLANSTAPFADFAGKLLGPWGRVVMAAAAVIACTGALNGWILLQGQIPLAAAKDQLFPKFFGIVTKNRAPVNGILVSSVLVTCLLMLNFHKGLVAQFTFIISLATLAAIIAYLYTTITEFIIFAKMKTKIPKKTLIKTLTISGLAFLYTFWTIISAGQEIVFYGTLLLMSSLPVYAWMKWTKVKIA